jgi:GT2 family glycosyltransferase
MGDTPSRRPDMARVLEPIMVDAEALPTWDGAIWIGALNQSETSGVRLELVGAKEFHRARLLMWTDEQPRGFVETAVVGGSIDLATIRKAVDELPPVPARVPLKVAPPISLVICTRDRPDHLRNVLSCLNGLDYPDFEVVVVDNNPASGLTRDVVESIDSVPIRLVDAVGQGLSIARNVGLKSAKHDIVAFTDDDVVVDELWLQNLARGFARDSRVACVCGMVPTSEVLTPAQSYFDRRVGWARRCEPAIYDIDADHFDDPLFPFHVAEFGTGANFALRKDVAIALGGFDEGLGIGSPTGGGEDIDMFVRVLMGGHVLVREPSAVVWHRHRATVDDLAVQIYNYGLGLGAWSFKMLLRPKTFGMVLRRLIPGIKHLRNVTEVDPQDTLATEPGLDGLNRHEMRGVCMGPFKLLQGRFAGREAAPLKAISGKLLRLLDFRGEQMWGEPGNSILAGRLASVAVTLGLVGSLGAIHALPTFLLIILVGGFMFGGPGSLVMSWYPHLPTNVLVVLLPVVSAASCLLVVTGLLMEGFYNPPVVLIGLTVGTTLGGLARCAYLARRERALT